MCNRSEIEISIASSTLLPALVDAGQENAGASVLQQSEKELIARVSLSTRVNLSELREVLKIISKRRGSKDKKLSHVLLRGSRVIFPSSITIYSQSPSVYDLEGRRAYLLRRQEEREYARLIDDNGLSFGGNSISSSFREPIAHMKGQISIIANMFVCSFAMFGVGYYVGVQYKCDRQICTIFGLVGAVLILFIEMMLYIIRTHNVSVLNHYDEDMNTKHESHLQTNTECSQLFTGATREDHDLDNLYDTVISATDVHLGVEVPEKDKSQ